MAKHILNVYLPDKTWIAIRKLKGDGKIKSASGYIIKLVEDDLKKNGKANRG